MKNKFIKDLAVGVALSLAIFSCADKFEETPLPTGQTLVEVAVANDNFDILAAALTKTGLVTSLNNPNSGTFTVFAPTDAAFINYWNSIRGAGHTEQNVLDTIANLKPTGVSNPTIAALAGVLNYHIVSSKIPSSEITGKAVFATLQGARLTISKQGSNVILNANNAGAGAGNGANVTVVDVNALNGVIHSIDKVLIPVSVATIGNTLGFAVSYTTNPPTVTAGTTAGNNYDILSAAIRKTGLAPTLLPNRSPLPDFTVFAPNDAAFVDYLNAIDPSITTEGQALTAINALTELTNPKLSEVTEILKYHVVAGRVVSTDLTASLSVTTLLTGKNFTISTLGPPVTLTDAASADATVVNANILTNAGVVHGIGAVLNPNP
ncbi:MAG: fasciclin domain-containing protein [Cytophagales bacterium]|nr:fasciclin domain-containing protein [Cytophagales bacterium]